MMDFTDNLLQAMEQTVEQVRSSVDEQTLRAVAFSGADMFRDEAKRNALSHAKTYTIHRNIIVKRLEEESDGSVRQVYIVTVRKGPRGGDDAYYAWWVEKGHKFVPKNPNINARTGKRSNWESHREAAALEYGTATVPAYAYMRPAYESRKQEAVDVMTTKLAELITRNQA